MPYISYCTFCVWKCKIYTKWNIIYKRNKYTFSVSQYTKHSDDYAKTREIYNPSNLNFQTFLSLSLAMRLWFGFFPLIHPLPLSISFYSSFKAIPLCIPLFFLSSSLFYFLMYSFLHLSSLLTFLMYFFPFVLPLLLYMYFSCFFFISSYLFSFLV